MRLVVLHPQVAFRDCSHCRQWEYDETTGEPIKRKNRKTLTARRSPLPCERDKCPKGHWTRPIAITQQNLEAWQHYRECKAVGDFPDDPLVRRNAAIIARIEEEASRLDEIRKQETLMRIVGSR